MNGLFITGTDTDIGKTALSALLLAELRRRKINAAPMKPAQTGCNGNVPDLDYSLSMAGMAVEPETYKAMAPYTFEPACSPHLAAEMAGVEIDLAEIVIAARSLTKTYEFIIAEGAGGIKVPLNPHELMLDLMQALKLPIILAARPGLGTINHPLLSIQALRAERLDIAGVVFVATTPDESSFIEKDNITTIELFGKVPVLGTLPYCAALQTPTPNYESLPDSVATETKTIADQLGI